MAINKQTIISAFDDKLTLLQWLKTINKALDEAVLTGVEVRQKGNATFSFVVTFEDGTELESNEFVLAQGESINGATIRNGHLYLTLTNDEELDAGNVKPVTSFAINESQHLIVNYGDGTSQDLGAIFNGNVNIDGNFTANSIVENMNGYSFVKKESNENIEYAYDYASAVKNGNKITFIIFGTILKKSTYAGNNIHFGSFIIPSEVGQKLFPVLIDQLNTLGISNVNFATNLSSYNQKTLPLSTYKTSDTEIGVYFYSPSELSDDVKYTYRFEVTFLLSDNMAGN